MSRKPGARPPGQIRQSQIITTFGPRAMLDLPNHSVLVGGLDYWTGQGEEIVEPRLTAKLQALLEVPALKLYAPPPDQEDPTAPQTGISAWQFPEWFIVQEASTANDQSAFRSRMMVHRSALTGGKYIDQDNKRRPVVPIRFVRACRCGHIGDIDWRAFNSLATMSASWRVSNVTRRVAGGVQENEGAHQGRRRIQWREYTGSILASPESLW